jgi:hypothetical protein
MKRRRLTRDEVAKLVVKASSALVKAAAAQMPSPCRQRRRSAVVPLVFPVLDEEYTAADTRRMRSRTASRNSGRRRSPSSRLAESRCSVPILRNARHLRPGGRTKTELAAWPKASHASGGLRPVRLPLCVWRTSRAVDGDEATTATSLPRRTVMRGPWRPARRARERCGSSRATSRRFPMNGSGVGPGGSRRLRSAISWNT